MNQKGHICYLGNAASIHIVRWANYFAEHGWDVDLISWRRPLAKTRLHPSIKIHYTLLPPVSFTRYGMLLETACIIRKLKPDVIHAFYTGTFGVIGGLCAGVFGMRPVIITDMGAYYTTQSKGWLRHLIKYSFKNADLVTCCGQNLMGPVMKLGVRPEKIMLTYIGVDTSVFDPGRRSPTLVKRLFGEGDYRVMISARQFERYYDIETLIRSIPAVRERIPMARFIIVGKGSEEGNLKRLAESLNVQDHINFVGYIPHSEFPEYLASSDVYVSTSLTDGGVSLTTLEAMSCGVPVVVTDVADNSKYIADGVGGFIIPLKSPSVLAEKIVYLLENDDLRKRLGAYNRRTIEERQGYEKMMEKVELMYMRLLGTSKRQPQKV